MQAVSLLPQFVSLAAGEFPDGVAIEVPPSEANPERQRMTYRELDRLSSQWALRLLPRLEPEDIVAILLPRNSCALYVAQLAVLKAGGAYTCLEPSFPMERIQFVLEDADVSVVLTDATHRTRLRDGLKQASRWSLWDVATAPLGLTWEGSEVADDALPVVSTERLAYVIYTSGTTGQPKGVMIEHRSIVNLVESDRAHFGLTSFDRVAQSSSAAYDSSIEETYLAFGVGATLVVLDDDVVRLGPDLVPWLRKEQISVLCPPPTLLRTTLCDDPATALPDLRLLYVGGEALTRDLADRWAEGRWMENGYGPTECTVTVVRGRVQAGEPITIGRPVAGHEAWILNDALEPVADGLPGELCICGVGVARGYLNRPELTRDKFVEHPVAGRIYRTGDLVERSASGELLYLGRIDTQVKIRGYRVELESIEAHLCEEEGVQAAACTVQGEGLAQQLVAFVVPQEGHDLDPALLRQHLAAQLPVYMVPARIALLDELPVRSTSGKLDRKALPRVALEVRREGELVLPRDPLEQRIADEIARRLNLSEPLSIHDDFFALGGNSVLAAQAISTFRQHPETATLAVRDLYDAPTVAQLATLAMERTERHDDDAAGGGAAMVRRLHQEHPSEEVPRPLWVSLLQMLWNLGALAVGSGVAYAIGFHVFPWALRWLGVVPFLLLLPVAAVALVALYLPLSLGLAVAAKRLLIGTYRPGRYPVWGRFFWRNWIVQRLVQGIPWGLVEGTVFKNSFLRALGATIGEEVHIHHGVDLAHGGWDLLTLDDGVSVGRDAALRLVELQDGHLVVGPITVGKGATLETRAGLSPYSTVEERGFLTNLSMLPSFATLPVGQRWDGVPARPAGEAPRTGEPTEPSSWTPQRHGVMLLFWRWLAGSALVLPFLLLTFGLVWYWQLDAERILAWLFSSSRYELLVLGVLTALSVGGLLVFLAWQALLVRWMGEVRPGVYSRWSGAHIRWWLKNRWVEGAGNVLSGTLFWPTWLRWAGMSIGPHCEVSSIMEVTPELVSIDRESFFADGIYLGTAQFHRGVFVCGHTRFGRGTFLGNHAVVPGGTTLPPGVLLGVCTVADDTVVTEGSSWFGHPAFALPRREVVEADRSLTHQPSRARWWSRFAWEASRFVLGLYPLALLLVWFKTLPLWWDVSLPLFLGVVVPAYSVALLAALCLCVWAMKWILLGKTKPGQHPLWSCWCSRWDFLYVAWSAYARPALAAWEQTLWMAWWLRAMGVKVGRRVVLGSGFAQVVDPDMLHFEDNTTVACLFQAHSFEDRVLKMDHVHLREGCTAAAGAVVMYGADIGKGSHVGPHSVVMKHEHLLGQRYHLGCPTHSQGQLTKTTGAKTTPGD